GRWLAGRRLAGRWRARRWLAGRWLAGRRLAGRWLAGRAGAAAVADHTVQGELSGCAAVVGAVEADRGLPQAGVPAQVARGDVGPAGAVVGVPAVVELTATRQR